jgi:uncharacterized protein involved in exopolysaccharide biosynthesis
METESIQSYRSTLGRAPTLRDIAMVCFRHRQLILLTFTVIFVGSLVYVALTPRTYQAETKILVKRERADPVITPENNASPILTTGVTEEDLNSEVELLQSSDLLERVVITCGLDRLPAYSVVGSVLRTVGKISPEQGNTALAIPLAVRALRKNLKVAAIRKTNLIQVSYASPDPNLAAAVLKTLTSLYLQKHLEVHRPPGTFAFFQQEASQYWEGLQAAERKLADFNRAQNTVSAQTEKVAGQQRLADFTAALRQSRTGIAATEGRIQTLTSQMASTPNRMTTEIRTNSLLLQQLKSTLLTLELKQTELAGKYAAGYVPLREVEAQIVQTKAAIAKEENLPLHDDTTDRNPTYQWMANELAKARTDDVSLRKQALATDDQIRAYRAELLVLDGKDLEQQDLLRAAKIQETNYLLYQNKREEARISDALDEKHIANVAVAEAATTPALPSSSSLFVMLFVGLIVASSGSVGLAFGKEYLNGSLRNPDDVRLLLEIPVLASFPKTIIGQDRSS